MPLHLSQHKSYHPYNRANKERVQRDQLLATHQEERHREVSFEHRDQARLEALRSGRSCSNNSPRTSYEPLNRAHSAPATQPSAHPKLQTGHPLLRPEDERQPWYTSPHLRNGADSRKTDEQRLEDAYKDSTTKSAHDPLKAMQSFLAKRKAAKNVPPSFPSSSKFLPEGPSDLYEPEAVRAAKSRRQARPRRRTSPLNAPTDEGQPSHKPSPSGHGHHVNGRGFSRVAQSRYGDRHRRHLHGPHRPG